MNIIAHTPNSTLSVPYLPTGQHKAEPLTEIDKREVLDFLSIHPVNTVILAGWIRDYGIISPNHRGTFYSSRDSEGNLSGVAFIGAKILFHAVSEDAVTAFAKLARESSDVSMIFAKMEDLRTFWLQFRPEAKMPKVSRQQMICSGGRISDDLEFIHELRIATHADLDAIVSAHAEMVLTETGVDPLAKDADGFRRRCAKRVELDRVFVWFKDGELVFKTDVLGMTPKATYVEGLWVNPRYRGNRYSTIGLASLSQLLLTGRNTICGFLDLEHALADSLYRNAGFTAVDVYGRVDL